MASHLRPQPLAALPGIGPATATATATATARIPSLLGTGRQLSGHVVAREWAVPGGRTDLAILDAAGRRAPGPTASRAFRDTCVGQCPRFTSASFSPSALTSSGTAWGAYPLAITV
ncbi:hypothetical protein GCM10009646_86290 [Streptomyces aureus]